MRKNVIAIGYQDEIGHVVVTDVLSFTFPEMTPDQLGELSWILSNLPRLMKQEESVSTARQLVPESAQAR